MKGLELSRLYYRELCAPMLRDRFPSLADRIAAGLVGEGSECLGFDDDISRDHDWGAAVCLWLNRQDYEAHGNALRQALQQLPPSLRGYPARQESAPAAGRSGVLEIGSFYYRYIGHSQIPESLVDWLKIPESNLATATNGEVFSDPAGEFSRFRERLLAFYPEDVRLKKLAARCAKMAQSGQYNLPRCLARGEHVAAALAEAEFIGMACSAVFLLNRRYKPFYKWVHRALLTLPRLGREVSDKLSELVDAKDGCGCAGKARIDAIEAVSAMVIGELRAQGLSDATGDFLLEHAFSLQSGIHNEDIRQIDTFLG